MMRTAKKSSWNRNRSCWQWLRALVTERRALGRALVPHCSQRRRRIHLEHLRRRGVLPAREQDAPVVPKLSQVRSARDRNIRAFQIGVRSEFLESEENHEKLLHRSSTRLDFFQNSGIFARKFKTFGKFQHFLKYRRNSDKISTSEQNFIKIWAKIMKRIQK